MARYRALRERTTERCQPARRAYAVRREHGEQFFDHRAVEARAAADAAREEVVDRAFEVGALDVAFDESGVVVHAGRGYDGMA